jgi:hypothetical protein
MKLKLTFWGRRTVFDFTPSTAIELSPQLKTWLSTVIAKLWLHAENIFLTFRTILKLFAREFFKEFVFDLGLFYLLLGLWI